MKFIVRFVFLRRIRSSPAPAFGAACRSTSTAPTRRRSAQALDGVGLVKAEAIVAYRNAHGPFETSRISPRSKGIGPRIIEENREAIVFGKPLPPRPRGGSPHSLATWSWRRGLAARAIRHLIA